MMRPEILTTLANEKLAALHEEARIRRLSPRSGFRSYLAAQLVALATRLEPELRPYRPSPVRGN